MITGYKPYKYMQDFQTSLKYIMKGGFVCKRKFGSKNSILSFTSEGLKRNFYMNAVLKNKDISATDYIIYKREK